MNNTQRIIAIAGIVLFILIAVYPPWKVVVGDGVINIGYSFIGTPPIVGYRNVRIDLERLGIQWITALVTTVGLVKVCERKQ